MVVFDSKFVTEEEINTILDKIKRSGFISLTKIEKNRLEIYRTSDEVINEMVRGIKKNCKVIEKFIIESRLNPQKPINLQNYRSNLEKLKKYEYILEREYGIDANDKALTLMIKS